MIKLTDLIKLLLLKFQNRIVLQIAHVNLSPLFYNLWVFLATQPAHVSEEKSSTRIVWISVGIGEFVVDSVISSPVDDWFLAGSCLQDHHQNFELLICLESAMSEKSMRPDCSPEAGQNPDDPTDNHS